MTHVTRWDGRGLCAAGDARSARHRVVSVVPRVRVATSGGQGSTRNVESFLLHRGQRHERAMRRVRFLPYDARASDAIMLISSPRRPI